MQALCGGAPDDFVSAAPQNQIAGKPKEAFVTAYHANPSLHEVQSWQNSLLQMAVNPE